MLKQKSYVKGEEFPPLKRGTWRVYSMRFCPYAQRTRLVLEHKNIPFETVNVSLTEKPEWFLDRNPHGKVPVLEHDDKILYESNITSDYVDDVYPDCRLTPSDPYRRARDKILFDAFGKVTTAYYATLRVIGGKEGDLDKLVDDFRKSIQPFEQALKERGSSFFGGEKPAMLDFMVWPHIERVPAVKILLKGTDLVPEEMFPAFTSWVKNMLNLEAVKKTMFDAEMHVQFFKLYSIGKPEYDIGL